MSTGSNYEVLIRKIDEFIRKYYKNQLIRGFIYSVGTLLAFYLLFTAFEYFGHFGTGWRTSLFYIYLAVAAFILIRLIFIPFFHLCKIGKVISHEQAAEIIGQHFTHVKDKLLNTLQLKKHSEENNGYSSELIEASINQKISELNPVPFTAAVDLSRNKKYLKWALVPLLVFAVVVFTSPSLLKDGTSRLINHRTYFAKPAPFQFVILNDELKVVQQEDFQLNVKMEGAEIPENIYVEYGGSQFRLNKENTVTFNYVFRNVQQNTPFTLTADGFSSSEVELKALPNPLMLDFEIALDYPGYTGKADEQFRNNGDLIIPAGTRVKWNFKTRNTHLVKMTFHDTTFTLKSNGEDQFGASRTFLSNNNYSVLTSNAFMSSKEPMHFNVNVIPDLHPGIEVEEEKDSVYSTQFYFRGITKDDYGFSKLNFTCNFLKSADSVQPEKKQVTENISINRNSNQEQFFYFWDLSKMGVMPGDEIEYYFEVWDNDGVHGAKSTRSQAKIFKAPTLNELAENAEKNNKALKDDLEKSIMKAKNLQDEINKAANELMQKKNPDWEDRKKMEDLLKKQEELEQKVEQIQKNNERNAQQENEFRKKDSDLAEKHKQLQDMMQKLMSPEMKELMKKLEELLSQMDKNKIQEQLEKMKLDNKDLEKELDRALELFKQLELEQKINEAIENLNKLAEEQENLSDKSLEKDADSKQLEQQQQALNEKFDNLKKELDDIEKKNSEMEYPQELSDTEKQEQEISNEQQQSKESLSQSKNKKASGHQKSASDKMKEMAQQMKEQQEQEEMEQAEEDMNALRQLLENLIIFSFDQEKLMQDLQGIDVNNPKYVKLSQQQRKLKDDAKILEDSLFALSQRVIQIQSIVNQEMNAINSNLAKSIRHLQERIVPQARAEQQYVMTSVNNLALMLDESLNQMQQQMAKMQGNAKCKKPGQGKPTPSAAQMRKMQQQLGEQMKQLQEQLKKGEKPGANKKAGQQGSMSEQLARMAAQQEAIRQELQRLNREENGDGGSLGDLDKLSKLMEETEKDLVNKRLTEETLKRQQEILTRLLESEKAERERELEEKRESNESKIENLRNPSRFEEYKKLKMQETELLKTLPPAFNTFYRNLVNYYFQSLQN